MRLLFQTLKIVLLSLRVGLKRPFLIKGPNEFDVREANEGGLLLTILANEATDATG